MFKTERGGVAASYRTRHAEAKRPLGEDTATAPVMKRARETMALLSRYFAVGLVNTAIGYSIILIGLRLGMGDYAANAAGYTVGLMVSYALQRRWAFAVSTPPSIREAGRFCAAAAVAYGANIGVIHLARSMGHVGSPIAQAVAMVAYSVTFFVLSRFMVFAQGSPSAGRDGDPPITGRSAGLPARHDAGPVVGWLQSPFTFVLLCVLGSLPLVFTTMPPLTDLGGHLGRFAVQLDGGASASLRQWYSFHWNLIPNLGTDLLMQVLAPSLGLEPALKLIVVAIPALQIAGWLLLARAVHGHVPPTALFVLPLAYGYPFQFGFLNFTLTAALATCLLALWIEWGNRARADQKRHQKFLTLRWAIFVPLACVLWIAHLVGWAIFLVFAGADELWRRMSQGQRLDRAALGSFVPLSCLLAPWFLKLLWPAAPTGHGDTAELFRVVTKLGYLIMPFRDRWEVWDIASALVILALIGWCWKSVRFTRHGGLALGTMCLAGLFVIMPGQALGSHYADMRLLPTTLAMALIAVRPNAQLTSRAVHALALIGLIFAGARILGNGASMALFDRQFSQDLAVLEVVPRDTQLVSLVLDRCDKTYGPWPRERRNHLGGYAIARRHDFSNDQWLIPGGQLLEVHNPDAGTFTSDPSQLTHDLDCHDKPGVVQIAGRVPLAIRYLWVLENGVARHFAGWHPIRKSAGSVLYTRDQSMMQ